MTEMKIIKYKKTSNGFSAETTGAEFLFIEQNGHGEVHCTQKIGVRRKIAVITLSCPLQHLMCEEEGADYLLLHRSNPPDSGMMTIRINADSMIEIENNRELKVRLEVNLTPEYQVAEDGHFLYIDNTGGLGVYTLGSSRPYCASGVFKKKPVASFSLARRQKMLISVFPPRKYDSAAASGYRIVHHFEVNKPYPASKDIKNWSKWGNILVLHSTIWKGRLSGKKSENMSTADVYLDAPFARKKITARNDAEFRRVIEDAHACGMKLLPYLHPFDYPGTANEFMDEVKKICNEFNIDDLYYDGVSHEIMEAYTIMKETRALLGMKLLYVHCPSPILGDINTSYFNGFYAYCPFIDTYADMMLRAEHMDTIERHNLRYTVNGKNISNTIGFLCSYDYSVETVRKSVDLILANDVRLPYWTGRWVGGEQINNERPENDRKEEELQKIMQKLYFLKLKN